MSRWIVVNKGEDAVDIFVEDPQFGRTRVGTLYLNPDDADDLEQRLSEDR